jgi:hypothetical protein
MDSPNFKQSTAVEVMSADNKLMTVRSKVSDSGEFVIELLPRMRYRLPNLPPLRDSLSLFYNGVLLVEDSPDFCVAINLSDRTARLSI